MKLWTPGLEGDFDHTLMDRVTKTYIKMFTEPRQKLANDLSSGLAVINKTK
ncbi:MAG: hypothetical protein AB8U25_06715 [Rickettsiales endosymbiont of Dermacentor nuttalli]